MRRMVLLCLLTLSLLSGCAQSGLPQAREMGDMALLRTMGVDAGEEPGQVSVTVSTGRRAQGIQGSEAQPPLVLSAQRDSLSAACLAMQGLSDYYVFFGYVDQLLIGERQAQAGVKSILEYFARDTELGLGARVWLVRDGAAGDAVRSGGDSGVERRLTTLRADSQMGVSSLVRTAGETLTALLEDGAAYLPAIQVTQAEGEGQTALLENGYGVLVGDGLGGWLTGEAARGLELLAGQELQDVLELNLPVGQVVVRITGVGVTLFPERENGALLGGRLRCQVAAEVAEAPRALSREELDQVTKALEDVERRRGEAALSSLQAWGADCLSLGRRMTLAELHRSELGEGWGEKFAQLDLTVQVEAEIRQR